MTRRRGPYWDEYSKPCSGLCQMTRVAEDDRSACIGVRNVLINRLTSRRSLGTSLYQGLASMGPLNQLT